MAFATVADLLLPLRRELAELPPAQRQALEVCLALSAGPAAGPLAACAGALGVLASAADKQPLAVLVDDFQWVDPGSRQILLFAARRLAAERIVMILTVRDEPGAQLPEPGLPTLQIGGLSVTECAELARERGADVSGPALRSLAELTGGNPLAVLENLAEAADGTSAFPSERLTLGRVLENAWGRVFEELPEDTRNALFVVATDAVSGGRHVEAALGTLHVSLASLAPAERRGLMCTADGQIQLRHPLIRPVIVGGHRYGPEPPRAGLWRQLPGGICRPGTWRQPPRVPMMLRPRLWRLRQWTRGSATGTAPPPGPGGGRRN